jgi:4-hydroxy-tetrahydrodipicolinate reductase
MGSACLRELLRRPEFEVVGVLAYNPEKAGKDAGELIGHAPIGVKVTTDKNAILAQDADCVLYCVKPNPTLEKSAEMDEEIIRILESGKNIVTPAACHFAHAATHSPDYARRIEAACRKGNSSIHGTGENPGFWLERVALTLTAVCNDVESISVSEYADNAAQTDMNVLRWLGYGATAEQARQAADTWKDVWTQYMFAESLSFASQSVWGRPLDRIEVEPQYFLAEQDYVFEKSRGDPIDYVVKQGTVKAMTFHVRGYMGDTVRVAEHLNWFLTPRASPYVGKADSQWDFEIEGKPTSLKGSFCAMASVKKNWHFYPGDPTSPTWYASLTPMLQAIPVVCAAEPGIVYASAFTSCVPDLRLLEQRKTLVG